MCTYNKVNTVPALDIWLTVVSIEYRVEPFKGLSCFVPLRQPVHPFGLMRLFFFQSFLHEYVLLFGRLMEHNSKHTVMTYSLTLFLPVAAILIENIWVGACGYIVSHSKRLHHKLIFFLYRIAKTDSSWCRMFTCAIFWQWVTYSTSDNGVICE